MGGLGAIIGGLVGGSQTQPTIDISQLLKTIQANGGMNQDLINQLPAQVQQLLAKYQQQNSAAGDAYKTGVTGVGNDLMAKTASLYGPSSDAANAQNVANKQAIYSTVPGTQDAVRNAMAATGGLSRGNAGVALAQPYVQAAQQYGQAAAGVNAQQTQAAQHAQQQALSAVASMNEQMFTQLFGMSKQQAQQILSSGNTALMTQLADLINSNNQTTSQTLNAQGVLATNDYNNALVSNAYQNELWNGVGDAAIGGISSGIPGAIMSGMSGGQAGQGGYLDPRQYNNTATSGTAFPTALSL